MKIVKDKIEIISIMKTERIVGMPAVLRKTFAQISVKLIAPERPRFAWPLGTDIVVREFRDVENLTP